MHIISVERMDVDDTCVSDIEKNPGNLLTAELDHAKENVCSDTNKHTNSTETQLKLEVRSREDFILKKACVIEAKRKRVAHLSICAFTSANHHKSHWDFVLEEMAWLANDFAQERLWKITAAAQLCQHVSFSCRKRLAEKLSLWEQKKGAHTLSEAVMDFWLSAEELRKGNAMQLSKRDSVRGVQEYAVNFLKYNKSYIPFCLPEAPVKSERISDLGTQGSSREEQSTEENLFYMVPPGGSETYRKAIESHLEQIEMPVGQRGPGSPWSSFEEQDLGPNWELISDAINNFLQYKKCTFRKPKDCSEYHKELIYSKSGDRVYNAEDSGSSQPYPSRIPGIQKGEARALFQRLQESKQEDMIKFHFEKIIVLSQKLHYIKMQKNENQEQKPYQHHSSHVLALSQVCPNYINEGPIPTPLELVDAPVFSTDVLSGRYQGTHVAGLGLPNHGNATSFHLTSCQLLN